MRGTSGDRIIIDGDTIVKLCETNQARFLRNVLKQKKFNNQFIKSVKVIEQGIIENKCFIRMPYIKYSNQINVCVENKLINYIQNSLDKSYVLPFDYHGWKKKIDDLKVKITCYGVIPILNEIREIEFKNDFYYGDCHGDFTLDNLLFCDDEILAIDFLDTFINSPVLDIVKLRQSTFHGWNDRKEPGFDNRLNNIIKSDKILNEYYMPIQILNLARILPYSKEEQISEYLFNEIETVYNTYNSIRRSIN